MKNFEIEQIDDGIIIKKYIGNCDIVNIPEEHDGKKVFLIDNGAFKNSKVKRVYISNNIKVIDEVSFFNCQLLEEVFIGSGCTHIGSSAFTDCHSMISYKVNNENPTYSDVDGVLMNREKSCIIKFPVNKSECENYSIPPDVTCLFDKSFQSSTNLYKVTLNNVNYIGNHTFFNCKNLISVVFDINKEYSCIGNLIFWNCVNLKKVNLPLTLKRICYGLFRNCKSLDSIIIPSGVNEICDDAFYGCESLKSIVIPKEVLRIGDYAFANCTNLESIYFEEGYKLKELGDFVFKNSFKLQTINRTFEDVIVGLNITQNCPLKL